MEQQEAFFFVQLLISDSKRKASVPGTNQPPLPLVSDGAFGELGKRAEQRELPLDNAVCYTGITGGPTARTRLLLIARRSGGRNTAFRCQGFQSTFQYHCTEFLKGGVNGSKGPQGPTSVSSEGFLKSRCEGIQLAVSQTPTPGGQVTTNSAHKNVDK